MAARNEAHNLEKLLISIFNQSYSDFEVIVVNDRSDDNSLEILEEFKKNNPAKNFHFISINEKPQNWNGKKYALHIGIQAAKNEIILLTDADCLPKDRFWIEKMANSFSDKEINTVVGISLYKKERSNFLNWFIQNETLLTALQYISFANFGMAYMGVGRNLAYKKSVFLSSVEENIQPFWVSPTKTSNTIGFEKIASQLGGDDDLIFSEKRFYKNVGICLDGQTESKAPQGFREWLHQKRRHLSVGTKYSFRQKVISSIYPLSIFFWYIAIIGFFINGFYEVLGFELIRQLLFFAILRIFYNQIQNNYVSSRFTYKNFYKYLFKDFFTAFLGFEFVFIFYYFVVGIGAVFFPPKRWK
ncbi:glycosyltransferase [Bernardetia sp. Wsw4-3y2]|uniref:glycosyltransferase n=1 Tax=Bernardetia sp. Wsw4-3y2 TaxID=3127471 RepID=UPI0030D3573A